MPSLVFLSCRPSTWPSHEMVGSACAGHTHNCSGLGASCPQTKSPHQGEARCFFGTLRRFLSLRQMCHGRVQTTIPDARIVHRPKVVGVGDAAGRDDAITADRNGTATSGCRAVTGSKGRRRSNRSVVDRGTPSQRTEATKVVDKNATTMNSLVRSRPARGSKVGAASVNTRGTAESASAACTVENTGAVRDGGFSLLCSQGELMVAAAVLENMAGSSTFCQGVVARVEEGGASRTRRDPGHDEAASVDSATVVEPGVQARSAGRRVGTFGGSSASAAVSNKRKGLPSGGRRTSRGVSVEEKDDAGDGRDKGVETESSAVHPGRRGNKGAVRKTSTGSRDGNGKRVSKRNSKGNTQEKGSDRGSHPDVTSRGTARGAQKGKEKDGGSCVGASGDLALASENSTSNADAASDVHKPSVEDGGGEESEDAAASSARTANTAASRAGTKPRGAKNAATGTGGGRGRKGVADGPKDDLENVPENKAGDKNDDRVAPITSPSEGISKRGGGVGKRKRKSRSPGTGANSVGPPADPETSPADDVPSVARAPRRKSSSLQATNPVASEGAETVEIDPGIVPGTGSGNVLGDSAAAAHAGEQHSKGQGKRAGSASADSGNSKRKSSGSVGRSASGNGKGKGSSTAGGGGSRGRSQSRGGGRRKREGGCGLPTPTAFFGASRGLN